MTSPVVGVVAGIHLLPLCLLLHHHLLYASFLSVQSGAGPSHGIKAHFSVHTLFRFEFNFIVLLQIEGERVY